jgi:hypothetical protein
MTTAGASTKDIKTAQLAFKRQESLFEEKLKKLSSSFGEDRERMGALKSRARKELSEVRPHVLLCLGGFLFSST